VSGARHYHVLVGLRGLYMPNENHIYRTLKAAREGAAEIADFYRDQGEDVSGSASSGYLIGENESIELVRCDDARCLDRDD
jgi:hypothetical protein